MKLKFSCSLGPEKTDERYPIQVDFLKMLFWIVTFAQTASSPEPSGFDLMASILRFCPLGIIPREEPDLIVPSVLR
jgi:hypothetical protein